MDRKTLRWKYVWKCRALSRGSWRGGQACHRLWRASCNGTVADNSSTRKKLGWHTVPTSGIGLLVMAGGFS